VIMAAGLGVTKEPGTDRFAERFHRAGYSVLAFDYRNLGESGGTPRQLVRISEQLADWQAAIGFAATLPGVAADKLAIWGFSASGGHVFTVAARNPRVAAAIGNTRIFAPRSGLCIQRVISGESLTGTVLGIAQTLVKPPAAAATVPVAMVSL